MLHDDSNASTAHHGLGSAVVDEHLYATSGSPTPGGSSSLVNLVKFLHPPLLSNFLLKTKHTSAPALIKPLPSAPVDINRKRSFKLEYYHGYRLTMLQVRDTFILGIV